MVLVVVLVIDSPDLTKSIRSLASFTFSKSDRF
jgi:hypothetical protein